ncbi:MAG: OadG family protein [Victivallaceae bacterium]|nr:OadG family protein [Victivallaceae bacterium]
MDLIIDGFKLLVIGMGWVFVFLLIMIGLMALVAKLVTPFAHMLETPAPAPRKPAKKVADSDDKSLIAAIIAAVHQHRNR